MGIAALISCLIGGFLLGQAYSKFLRDREDRAFRPLEARHRRTWGSRRVLSPDAFVPVMGPGPGEQPCWVCGRSKSAPDGHNHKQPDGFCRH